MLYNSNDDVFQADDQNDAPINSDSQLLHINDDCLMEIFAVKSLTPMDMCALAQTCTRFKQIIERIFPKVFDIRFNDDHHEINSKYSSVRGNKAADIEHILRNFGSFLSEIAVSTAADRRTSEERAVFVLNLVAKCCVDALSTLRIGSTYAYFEIPVVLTVQLKPIFRRLQLLELVKVSVVDDATLFADFDSLVELRVIHVRYCDAILENVFPQLKRMTFVDTCRKSFNIVRKLTAFIARSTSLKTLDLDFSVDEKWKQIIVPDIVQAIGNSCSELERLSFHMVRLKATDLLPLRALKSLKSLKLLWVSCDDLTFIASMTQLHELHLCYCILPKNVHQFTHLTHIRKLHIVFPIDSKSFDVVDVVRRLTNLDELTVRVREVLLDEKTFSQIVRVCCGRPKRLTLKCKFDSFDSWNKCDINQNVRLMRLD